MELNERIASVRKAAGLTQEQLGELVEAPRFGGLSSFGR